jgi:hypothetical protein
MNDEVEVLRAALAALKESGAIRAQVELGDLKLNVEFPMDLRDVRSAAALGAAPVPGGWKGPTDLDSGFQDDQS